MAITWPGHINDVGARRIERNPSGPHAARRGVRHEGQRSVNPLSARFSGSGMCPFGTNVTPGEVYHCTCPGGGRLSAGVVTIASGNPMGLVVSSGVDIYGEESGKSRVTGRTDQTAKETAANLRVRSQQQGPDRLRVCSRRVVLSRSSVSIPRPDRRPAWTPRWWRCCGRGPSWCGPPPRVTGATRVRHPRRQRRDAGRGAHDGGRHCHTLDLAVHKAARDDGRGPAPRRHGRRPDCGARWQEWPAGRR